jgi:putative tryptophan/tyrosine transport system substrate-binding protein
MRRREFITMLGAAAAWPLAARAQQSERVWRIGVLHVVPPGASMAFAAFRKRLRELGYIEGQNCVIEYRWSDQPEQFVSLVTELISLGVNVIVTGDATTTAAASHGTRSVPIVVAVLTVDPVAAGFVSSLGHPGGNITGLSLFAPEMSSKRLELLAGIVAGLKRVAVLWDRRADAHPALLRETTQTANRLGISLVQVESAGSDDIEQAFQRMVKEQVEGLVVLQAAEFYRIRKLIADLGLKHRMPIIAGEDGFAQLGGLIKYGPSPTENWRQAAGYVDRILKGAKPAEMPIEQPTKFELVINLKTAKELGLTVPLALLALADEVIE